MGEPVCLRCGTFLTPELRRVPLVDLCTSCTERRVVLGVDVMAVLWTLLVLSVTVPVLLLPAVAAGRESTVLLILLWVVVWRGPLLALGAWRTRRVVGDVHARHGFTVLTTSGRRPGVFTFAGDWWGSDRGVLLIGEGAVFLGVRGTRLAARASELEIRVVDSLSRPGHQYLSNARAKWITVVFPERDEVVGFLDAAGARGLVAGLGDAKRRQLEARSLARARPEPPTSG